MAETDISTIGGSPDLGAPRKGVIVPLLKLPFPHEGTLVL